MSSFRRSAANKEFWKAATLRMIQWLSYKLLKSSIAFEQSQKVIKPIPGTSTNSFQ